jgi:hypothetical protein
MGDVRLKMLLQVQSGTTEKSFHRISGTLDKNALQLPPDPPPQQFDWKFPKLLLIPKLVTLESW